jgi:hypothetical protein
MKLGFGPQASTPCVADVDYDGDPEIVVAANTCKMAGIPWFYFAFPTRQAVYAMERDGTLLPGWPQYVDTIPPYNFFRDSYNCQVIAEDLDDDGMYEIICATGNQLIVYNRKGQVLWKRVARNNGNNPWAFTANEEFQYELIFGALATGDVNGDGIKEIVARFDWDTEYLTSMTYEDSAYPNVCSCEGEPPPAQPTQGEPTDPTNLTIHSSKVVVLNKSGTMLDGWPAHLPGGPAHKGTHLELRHGPGVACYDIDNDGKDEVIPASFAYQLNVFDEKGRPEAGWPRPLDGSLENETPAVADLDGDNKPEIVVSAKGPWVNKLHVFRGDGSAFWSKGIDNWGRYPVIADVNGDGRKEIVTNGYWYSGPWPDTGAAPPNMSCGIQVSYWHLGSGPGFTTQRYGAPQSESRMAVGDVTGDGTLELVYGGASFPADKNDPWGSSWTDMRCYSYDLTTGYATPGFPLNGHGPEESLAVGLREFSHVRSPLLADIDSDSKVEILACSDNGNLNLWDTSGSCPKNRRIWPFESGSPYCANQYAEYPVFQVKIDPSMTIGHGTMNVELKGTWYQPDSPFVYYTGPNGPLWMLSLVDDGTHKRFTTSFSNAALPYGNYTLYAQGENLSGDIAFASKQFSVINPSIFTDRWRLYTVP